MLVILTDENDNTPRFTQDNYFTVIFENRPPLTPVFDLAASDRDDPATPNAQLTFYEISGDDPGKTLSLSQYLLLSFYVDLPCLYTP